VADHANIFTRATVSEAEFCIQNYTYQPSLGPHPLMALSLLTDFRRLRFSKVALSHKRKCVESASSDEDEPEEKNYPAWPRQRVSRYFAANRSAVPHLVDQEEPAKFGKAEG
jgi:hypothetical protein